MRATVAATSAGHALLRMVYTSLVASVAIALVFSLAVYGLSRAGELRRVNRTRAAAIQKVIGILALAAFAVIVVYGLILVGHKS